jgi:hypothetical protein
MANLIADVGELAGKTLVATHIDSWEVGSQNWTPRFREEFRRRRGYDPLPYLPVITGRVVESWEVSERFLWDWRQTVSELLVENYAGHLRTLAHRHGLRLSIEAYGDCVFDDMAYAGRADEPMAEFWTTPRLGGSTTLPAMASAAHVYGKRVVGAEAFTADSAERWLHHPGSIKSLGDWAFCQGINRRACRVQGGASTWTWDASRWSHLFASTENMPVCCGKHLIGRRLPDFFAPVRI